MPVEAAQPDEAVRQTSEIIKSVFFNDILLCCRLDMVHALIIHLMTSIVKSKSYLFKFRSTP